MPMLPEYLPTERRLLTKLNSPEKIQDYLDGLPINFETRGETYMSPRQVMRLATAHCMEGALFAAAALEFHGQKPLLMDLSVELPDTDHVVALFKRGGYWGSISKTNHAVLRYREPVYKTLRELALSFFHEYFTHGGRKSLREYSAPFSLVQFNKDGWQTSEDDLFDIVNALDASRHYKLINSAQVRKLRKASKIEIAAGKLIEWKEPRPAKRKSP